MPDAIPAEIPAKVRALPQLRYRTVVRHDSFCERLHQAITKELGIGVEKQPCATSVELSEEPILYSGTIDSLTLWPLSIKYQVLLDFGKPLNLPPDGCSKLTLAENLEELRPFVAGHTTPNLDQYETVARRG